MNSRFQYVVAVDMKALVEELNKRAEEYWFTVVYMANGVAVLDSAVNLVTPVDEEDYTDIQLPADKPAPSFA